MILVALFSFGAIVHCPSAAVAQSVPPSQEVLTEHQVREFRSWIEKTRASDFDTRSRWHRIFTRSARSALPNLGRHLITKGGLAGVAAGVWIHNGVTLYTGLAEPAPEALVLSVEYRQAEESLTGRGAGGFFRYYETDGTLVGSGALLSVSYSFQNGRCRGSFSYAYTSTHPLGYAGYFGIRQVSGSTTVYCRVDQIARHGLDNPLFMDTTLNSTNDAMLEWYTFDVRGPEANVRRPVAPAFPATSSSNRWENPVFDWGSSTIELAPPEYTPPEGDYVATPQETRDLYDAIRSDPEYQPATDDLPREDSQLSPEEREKKFGPVVWTRENPDGSTTTRYADGTEITEWPDGTTRVRYPDGREQWEYPDGTIRRYNPRTGEEVTEYPDGTTRTRQYPPGTPSHELPHTNPTTEIVQYPDGTTRTRQNPNTNEETEQWTDPTGQPQPRPDPERYPEPSNPPTPGTGTPTGGPTNQSGSSCNNPRQSSLELPELDVDEKFPFSLILWTGQSIQMLASPGDSSAPCLDLPMFNRTWCFSEISGIISLMRNLVWFFGAIFLCFFFYQLIKGGSKTE